MVMNSDSIGTGPPFFSTRFFYENICPFWRCDVEEGRLLHMQWQFQALQQLWSDVHLKWHPEFCAIAKNGITQGNFFFHSASRLGKKWTDSPIHTNKVNGGIPPPGHCILTVGPAAVRIYWSAAVVTNLKRFLNWFVRQKSIVESNREVQTLIEVGSVPAEPDIFQSIYG